MLSAGTTAIRELKFKDLTDTAAWPVNHHANDCNPQGIAGRRMTAVGRLSPVAVQLLVSTLSRPMRPSPFKKVAGHTFEHGPFCGQIVRAPPKDTFRPWRVCLDRDE